MDGKAFLELAWARHSVRKYDARPVEPEKMAVILDAAKAAPTAVNFQPQRLYVVGSAEGKERLETAMKFRFGAPVLIAVCYDRRASWKRGYDGQEFGDIDAAIVTTHMMLAAEADGLSSVWIGSFDPKRCARRWAWRRTSSRPPSWPWGMKRRRAATAPSGGVNCK